MKIEKINENQIRVTLTRADLTAKKINLSELSYGSEKAKNLFHDLMLQAKLECGFDPNGTPIMIEAIPLIDSLILNVTKVSNPEELDTRFSSFSTPQSQAGSKPHFSGADGILNMIKKATEAAIMASSKAADQKSADSKNTNAGKDIPDAASSKDASEASSLPIIEAFRFNTLDEAIAGAKAVSPKLKARNSLYKFEANTYILVLHSHDEDPELFNRTCNVLSEYSVSDHISEGSEFYLREHGYLLIADCAIKRLSAL